jgi:hypothetical protein
MKNRFRRSAVFVFLAVASLAEAQRGGGAQPPPADRPPEEDVKLPNGKSQKDEILKSEHAQNVKDAQELVELAQELRDNVEKNDRYVLSLADLKKTDDIEKLVKKIRGRLRRN